MKLKLIIHLLLYAAVIAFIAIGIGSSEAALGQKASIECKYNIIINGEKTIKENCLEINSKKFKDTPDSIYISLSIYNRGPEELTLGSKNFILMEKENPICELRTGRSTILPEKQREIILAYSKSGETPDCIDVVKYGGSEAPQKLFSIKL